MTIYTAVVQIVGGLVLIAIFFPRSHTTYGPFGVKRHVDTSTWMTKASKLNMLALGIGMLLFGIMMLMDAFPKVFGH